MNEAHSHLLINHFPIIGLLFGILVLLIGIIAKSSVTRRVGLLLFLVAGITSFPSFKTGEGAEHPVEHSKISYPKNVDFSVEKRVIIDALNEEMEEQKEHLIHEHEEKAEALMPFMWGIIGLSLIALYLEWKKKSMALMASIVVLIVGCLAAYFAREVGNSGGLIAHPEIRTEKASAGNESHEENDMQDDD